MTSYARQSVLLGLAITALVVAIELLGGFRTLHRETIDLRFTHARWRDEPLSDQIRFVDIDDGALESVGRWPWPRSKLADAINELRRAGARTIALDVLLDDAQHPDAIDHDANLAEAMATVRCVLAVRVAEKERFDAVWRSEQGAAELRRLLDTLSHDVQLEPSTAVEQAELTGRRRARFHDRPLEFKKIAAYEALLRLARQTDNAVTFQQFVRAAAPGVDEHTGDFPERRLLRNAWEQYEAWRHIKHALHPPPSDGSYRDKAPLSAFAKHADLVGFVDVNLQQDSDGELRTIAVMRPAPGGSALQFGLAAAVLHRRSAASDVRVDDERAIILGIELPLDRGRLWLAWPTSETNWSGVLRRAPGDRLTAGRISIAALISLAEQRRKLARNADDLEDLALVILNRETLPQDGLSEELLEEVRGEVQFQLDSMQELIDSGVQLAAAEESDIAAYRHWRLLEDAVTTGRQRIAAAEQRLGAELKDRLVFVGMTATGTAADVVHTPLGADTPGVVSHAVVADMALSGRRVRLARTWTGWALAALLGLLCTSLASRLTPAYSTMFVLAILLGYVGGAGWWLFGSIGLILPLVAPVAAGAGSWIGCTALAATLFQRDRRRIARRFKSRVSPQLVDYLIENPNALSLAGEQREITVMFLDIAGFTAITESLDGPIAVSALNRCMSELTTHLTHHQGYVNKFLGDGLMAFWSAFREDPKHAVRACASALDCQEALQRLNRSEDFAHLPTLAVRIGIATGRVIVGDCGAPPLLNDYTAIGNDVNLASRLESANKFFGTGILITERTLRQLDSETFQTRPIGTIIVAGQSVPVRVYELLPTNTDPTIIRLTTEAVEAFASGDRETSTAAWNRLTQIVGTSTLAEFYSRAIADPTSAVDGILRLHEK